MRVSKFLSLFRLRDLGYLFAAIVGGLLVGALPSGAFVLCPSAKNGSDADYVSAVFAGLTFVATVLIAGVAHQLNKTLKSSEDRKSVVAARMYCKVAGAQIKHIGAKCAATGNALERFINGETTLDSLEDVSLDALHAYLYQNEIIGHLPDQSAQILAKFCADYVGAHDTFAFVVKRTPHALPRNFIQLDGRVQKAFRGLASDLDDCRKGATKAVVELETYLQATRHVL